MESTADIALIGLAVMGQNLILNMNDHGFTVVAYNRTTSKVDEFLAHEARLLEDVRSLLGSGRRAAPQLHNGVDDTRAHGQHPQRRAREAVGIELDVEEGRVTLSGVVHSYTERKAVVGAARVISNLSRIPSFSSICCTVNRVGATSITWVNCDRRPPLSEMPFGQWTIVPLRVPPQCEATCLVHW